MCWQGNGCHSDGRSSSTTNTNTAAAAHPAARPAGSYRYKVPLLVVGGGGYTLRNVARCWAYETGRLMGHDLPDPLPESVLNSFNYYQDNQRLRIEVCAHKAPLAHHQHTSSLRAPPCMPTHTHTHTRARARTHIYKHTPHHNTHTGLQHGEQ